LLRRLLSFVLVLSLLCVQLPAILQPVNRAAAESAFSDSEEGTVEAADGVEEDMYANANSNSDYAYLKRGDRDGDDSTGIVVLQNRLIALEYLYDSADGVYGENTEVAIKLFQTEHNLRETGIADPDTQALLFSDKAQKAPVRMDSKNVVSRVQEKLILWGFLDGKADGVNGSETKKSIKAFKTYLQEYLKIYPTPSPVPVTTPDPASLTGFGDGLVAMDMPLVLIIIGVVYIFETVSVILQVAYFKLTHGKRIFKMTPIHHHFEMCGWSENKIVSVFCACQLILAAVAYISII